jgi:ribonuclease P protein component
MLPAENRMRHGDEFGRAVRLGRRAGRPTLVVHALWADRSGVSLHPQSGDEAVDEAFGGRIVPAQVGFVVSRGVGGAVVRTRVKRRLRDVMRHRLSRLPAESLFVIRATSGAATASFATLASDVDAALARLEERRGRSA